MANQLTALASTINDGVSKLNAHLSENKLPCPSFDPEASTHAPLSPDAQGVAFAVMSAAQELFDLLRGPRELPIDHYCTPYPVYEVVKRFGIAEKVPLDGDISYTDLAAATGVEESALTRLLRYGTLHRIFQEKRSGYISHSAISKLLVDDTTFKGLTGMLAEDIVPGWLRIADALEKWPGADEPSQTAFRLAENSTQSTFFDTLAQTPGRVERFAESMSWFSKEENLAKDYPFGELGSGTLVEGGGSVGDVAFRIAGQYPELNIIVQDVPRVIDQAKEREAHQVSFMKCDFFEEQPVKGADAYMFRWVFHDWSDKYAARILKSLIPAFKAGTKLLIVDAVIPPFGTLPNPAHKRIFDFDTSMLVIANAKERTLDDWKFLLNSTDERFKLRKVVPLTNSHLSVLEIVWTP